MLDRRTDSALKVLGEAAEAYIQMAFGVRIGLEPVAGADLPHFLLDRYRIWRGQLNGEPILLVAMRAPGQGATTEFIKHRELLRRQLGVRLVLLLLDHVPSVVRRQMVERQIGFLAPGAQLYVPEALLDLRERTPTKPPTANEQFGPTTQLLMLASLLGEDLDDVNLTQLAERFQVAIMSMSRTLDELETLQLAKARHAGRQRRLHLVVRDRELWQAVEGRLQSPVRKVRTVRGNLPDDVAPLAGESALAHYTMLAEPRFPHRAIPAARWKQMQRALELRVGFEFDDDDRAELETWSYDPRVLAREPVVDRLSLYLSMRNDPDERVAQAAQQLLEPFEW
jgi:DNA-binding MarR family transcriptional regulator